MFKKSAIAALVLGFSGAASAAMYAPAPAPACSAGNVTVPCERSAWDLGVDGLYLRNDDNQFTGVNNYRDKYGWGFRVEGSYHFGTGNDATINWAHFNKTTNSTVAAVVRQHKSRFDMVNFEVAQTVNFGEMVDVRFHGGVAYDNIRDNGTVVAGSTNNKLTTFGPRVGATMMYDFGNGFGMFGGSALSLMSAKMTVSGTAAAASTTYTTAFGSEMNLGVSYTHAMAQGDLTGRLGWTSVRVAANSGVTAHSWNGVFFGLKWVGNA